MPPVRSAPAVLLGCLFCLAALAPAAIATSPVDLALVLAIDVSLSVDAGEYALQKEGIARAVADPAVVQAITAGRHGAIELAVLEWSGRDQQVVAVPWSRIDGAGSAADFATRLRAVRRSSHGLTDIGEALLAAQALLNHLPAPADRRLVDVSGDGMANFGPPVDSVRDRLVAAGITINGLAIRNDEPWIGDYYDRMVIGGPGAFLIEAGSFADFAQAMRGKLIGEVIARR